MSLDRVFVEHCENARFGSTIECTLDVIKFGRSQRNFSFTSCHCLKRKIPGTKIAVPKPPFAHADAEFFGKSLAFRWRRHFVGFRRRKTAFGALVLWFVVLGECGVYTHNETLWIAFAYGMCDYIDCTAHNVCSGNSLN